MNYIYDILLNFTNSKKCYDFFEWEDNDFIINVKKTPVFKVTREDMFNIYNYKVKVSSDFLKKIEGVSNVYKKNKMIFKHLAIFTDGTFALGISFNDNGLAEYKSHLLLDEEEEVLIVSESLKEEKVEYKKLEKMDNDNFITRKESEERDFLVKEIKGLYKNNNIQKLKFLYIEYFNKKEDDVDIIYNGLLDSLNNINEKHTNLYNLLKLTCKK